MMRTPVYLDYNATTPIDSRVLEAMLPFMGGQFGNPSSRHEYGRVAREAIDHARQAIAFAVGAHPTEVLLTSGGTEANNLFIKGAAACLSPGLLAISAVEHPSVMQPARQLLKQGWQYDVLPVASTGQLDLLAAAKVLSKRPALLSLMLANNETGTVQPVASLALKARQNGAYLHTDAVQAIGKLPVDFRALGVHAMTLSAHKIGGPKGVGALLVDKRIELLPLLAGGGQERGLRSGTENVAAIVGFGRACELLPERFAKIQQMCHLRDEFERGISAFGGVIFGGSSERIANTSFFAFASIDGETLVGQMDRAGSAGFALASGSACSSTHPAPSPVLSAMGIAPELARSAVRLSLGPDTSEAEIHDFLSALRLNVQRLQRAASVIS